MSEAATIDAVRRRPHPQPLRARFLDVDLGRELAELHAESEWARGRNAKTLLKSDDCRIVLTALKASARIPEHATDARVMVQVLAGHIQMRADGRTFDLRPSSLVTLDAGVPHDVTALDDSAFLITIVWAAHQGEAQV